MVMKIYLDFLFLIGCAGCTAAQELPRSCAISARCRERLTWLNISTLPNNTMTCLANIQKHEAKLKEYRVVLVNARNLINKRRRSRGQKSLPEPEFGMMPEGQPCSIPMFCNGKSLWGQFFVRDPATGKVTTKCRYEVKRVRARLDIMNADYKLIAYELAIELKIIPTTVSPTASCAPTIIPTEKPGAATSTKGDVTTTVEASTATSTHHDIPTTNPTEITTALSTTVKVSCDIILNGICYWTYAEDRHNINFAQAEEICMSMASTPAHFPNVEAYNAVLQQLRPNVPSGSSSDFWTGITIDANTGIVIHPTRDTYVKWHPGVPHVGSAYKTYTHVGIGVRPDPGHAEQGMYNLPPQESLHGVVCQSVK